MIQATLLRAGSAVLVLAALTACSDSTSPTQLGSGARSAGSLRSGTFQVEKECSTYTGHRDEICTITSSTLPEIEPGTTITYASDAAGILLDTDVRLDLPGPGNNAGLGHCIVNLATGLGGCVFSGGTGKFTWFHADVAVTPLGWPNFAWNGTYRFSPRD
jgi:hypothetical protein